MATKDKTERVLNTLLREISNETSAKAEPAISLAKEAYRLLKTTELNRMYFGDKQERLRRQYRILQLLLAVGTNLCFTLAIFGLVTPATSIIWKLLAAMNAILAILFPLLQFETRIAAYRVAFTELGSLTSELEHLLLTVKTFPDDVTRASKFLPKYEEIVRKLQRVMGLTDFEVPNHKHMLRLIRIYETLDPFSDLDVTRDAS